MGYFLSEEPLQTGTTVEISGTEAGHMRQSRRLRVGDALELQDPSGARFAAVVAALPGKRVTVRIAEPAPIPPPAAVRLTLLQAALKEKAAEMILRQITELGVAALIMFQAERSPTAQKGLAGQPRRWERIGWEACKQSGRAMPPETGSAPSLAAALAALTLPATATRWLLDPRADPTLALPWGDTDAQDGATNEAVLLVGPEGGLTEAELTAARTAGFAPVALQGPVLRAETAAVAGCALMLHGPRLRSGGRG